MRIIMSGVQAGPGMGPHQPSQHEKKLALRRNQRRNGNNSRTSIGNSRQATNVTGVPQIDNPEGGTVPDLETLKKEVIKAGDETRANEDANLRQQMGLPAVPE